MMISYAQNLEDVLLWRCLKNVNNGFYIDVGAHHSEIDSVTKWFYDNNWHGINIEPVQELFSEIEKNRPRDINLNVAAGDSEEDVNFYVVKDSPGLSSLKNDTKYKNDNVLLSSVKKRKLNNIIEENSVKDIHFLKIDVEGAEYDVIKGIDLTKFRPWIIISEKISSLGVQKNEDDLIDYITSNNYKRVWFDGLNSYFISNEHSDLFDVISVQPNVFDNFKLSSIVSLQSALRDTESSLFESQNIIQSQDEIIKDRDIQISTLETSMKESQNIIQNQDKIIRDRNLKIDTLENKTIVEYKEIIDILEKNTNSLSERIFYLEEVKNIIESGNSSLVKEISRLNTAIINEKANIERAALAVKASEDLIRSYENSTSWKMTAPVRAVKRRVWGMIRI